VPSTRLCVYADFIWAKKGRDVRGVGAARVAAQLSNSNPRGFENRAGVSSVASKMTKINSQAGPTFLSENGSSDGLSPLEPLTAGFCYAAAGFNGTDC
jgi:hypothetical protein